jgi:hypothetical protein
MKLVTPPVTQTRPKAEVVAERMMHRFNVLLDEKVAAHVKKFKQFWDDPDVIPDDILAAWGNQSTTMLAAASESLQHIGRLAAIVGKSVDDFIPARYYEPRRQFILAMDGTATLAPPAFGHDAWGRFIPVPEDPQRTGYLPDQTPVYGKYPDGTDALVPLPEGGIEWSFDREPIYGYEEDGTPILTPPAPEPTPEP